MTELDLELDQSRAGPDRSSPVICTMSDCEPAAVEEEHTATEDRAGPPEPPGPPCPSRPPLAEKALSEAFSRLRYRDTSLLVWQQQQQEQQAAPPSTYLIRSQSLWYSSFGNQAVLIRDKRTLQDSEGSRICSVM